jgi:hypothetical protein
VACSASWWVRSDVGCGLVVLTLLGKLLQGQQAHGSCVLRMALLCLGLLRMGLHVVLMAIGRPKRLCLLPGQEAVCCWCTSCCREGSGRGVIACCGCWVGCVRCVAW